MATLAQTVQQNKKMIRKPGGQLVEAEDDTQQLADNAGIPAAPTTPGGVGMIGGNPDQQKMAGTPAQEQSAFAASQAQPATPQSSEGSLAETMRRTQARTQATSEEAQAKDKEKKLGQLSTLQGRAQNFIQAATAKPAIEGQTLTSKAALVSDAAATFGVQGDATFNADAQALAAGNFTDAAKLADLANRAGMDENTFATRLKQLQIGTEQQTAANAAAAAKGVQDTATVSDMITKGGLEYQPAELAGLLGVDEAALGKMSITDLQNKIAEVEQGEFTKTQSLQEQANNPNLGPAERAAAQSALAEMSGVGVRSSEAQVARVEDAVERGDQITFGGKAYKLGDLLKDETISQIAADYVRNPNSPDAQSLKKENPDFAAFLDTNKDVFAKAAVELEKGIGTIKAAQASKNTLLGQTGIDKDMAEDMMPGFKKLSATGVSPPPVLTAAINDPGVKAGLQDVKGNKAAIKELAGLNADEINQLGMGQTGSKWDNWKTAQTAVKELEKRYNVAPGNPDAVLDAYFAEDVNPGYVEETVQKNQAANALGLPNEYGDYQDILGPDGTMRPSADILADLKSKAPAGYSVKDALGGREVPNPNMLRKRQPVAPAGNAIQQGIITKLGRMAAGGIDAQEAEQAALNFDELLDMEDRQWGPGFNDEAKGVLAGKIQANRKSFTDDLIKAKLPPFPKPQVDWSKPVDPFGHPVISNIKEVEAWQAAAKDQIEAVKHGPDAKKLDNKTLDMYTGQGWEEIGGPMIPVPPGGMESIKAATGRDVDNPALFGEDTNVSGGSGGPSKTNVEQFGGNSSLGQAIAQNTIAPGSSLKKKLKGFKVY